MDTFEIFGAITTLTASVISAVVAFITKKAYDKADEEKEYVEIKKAIDGIEIKYADNDNVLELMLRNVKELKEYYVISKDQARKSFSAALLICFLGFFIYMFGIAVPVLLMVACNVLDYATGLMASTYRSEDINSYKSIRGIMKKVCMWLLVIVGAIIDQLLLYATQTAGITLPFTFLVACIVAIWIICNEIISILENIKDMGVTIPAFLIPLVTHVKSQVEDKVNIDTEKEDSEGE